MKVKLSKNQKNLRLKILDLIYKSKRTHIGSCLNSIDIIDSIYDIKSDKEKFILSNGHAGMALYVVLIKYGYLKESDLKGLGIHPDRDVKHGIYASTGSLGQGLPIAVGLALGNRSLNTYCLISDGECAEGSVWESLRIIYEQKLINLKLLVSANGWGAYDPIPTNLLEKRFRGFGFQVIKIDGHNQNQIKKLLKTVFKIPTIIVAKTTSDQLPFLKGQDAHYYAMKEPDYKLAANILK